jgi:hypothetical protein
MSAIIVVIIGFGAGMLTMTVVNLYKWVFNLWKGGAG